MRGKKRAAAHSLVTYLGRDSVNGKAGRGEKNRRAELEKEEKKKANRRRNATLYTQQLVQWKEGH